MSTVLQCGRCEKVFFTRLRELGFDAECVFDVGSSNAAWSTTIAEVYPDAQFELFDPLTERFEKYQANLDWALDKFRSFRVHPFALGAENEERDFWLESEGVGSSLLVGQSAAKDRIRVPVLRMDDVVADQGLKQPQIIKMDVQGGEAQVIAGGPRTIEGADVLHIETWLQRAYWQSTPTLHEILEQLLPLNFVLVHLGDFYRHTDQTLMSVDAFFAHKRLIERLRVQGAEYPWPERWMP